MFKPASKLTRVTLVCLCLLGVGFGIYSCARRVQIAKEVERAAPPKHAAKLVIVNEGTCGWHIVIGRVGGNVQQWDFEADKSVETFLESGDYQVEQKLLMEESGVQVRRFSMTLEANQTYRWRLVNILSSDAQELELPVEGRGGR